MPQLTAEILDFCYSRGLHKIAKHEIKKCIECIDALKENKVPCNYIFQQLIFTESEAIKILQSGAQYELCESSMRNYWFASNVGHLLKFVKISDLNINIRGNGIFSQRLLTQFICRGLTEKHNKIRWPYLLENYENYPDNKKLWSIIHLAHIEIPYYLIDKSYLKEIDKYPSIKIAKTALDKLLIVGSRWH